MKTAMQEMIEYLLSETEMLMDKTRMILVAKADSLLELEKQQIQDAVAHGDLYYYDNDEDYYNQTFNQQP